VAVVIGSSQCGFSTWPVYMALVNPMLRSLQSQARAHGLQFAAIGVGVDEPADSGIAYLRRLAAFDEVVAGRGWYSTGLQHYVWPDTSVVPITPMLVLYTRQFTDGASGPRVNVRQPLRVLRGANDIAAFARSGATIDSLLSNKRMQTGRAGP
jgi:hypothetical protein